MSTLTGGGTPRDRRVSINCSGTLSQISLSLLQAHPLTLLAKLTSSLPPLSSSSVPSLASYDLFLDRDPASVATVLNWYRYGKLLPPPSLPQELLADDIVYFRLPLTSDAAVPRQQQQQTAPSTSREGSISFTHPGLPRMHSFAQQQQQQPGASNPPTPLPMSRVNSQFSTTGGGSTNEDTIPGMTHQPSFVPQLSRVASGGPAPSNYASLDETEETTGGGSGMEGGVSVGGVGGPAVQILPSIPPVFAPQVSSMVPQPIRPFTLTHQVSSVSAGSPHSAGAFASPSNSNANHAAAAYLNLGAGDVGGERSLGPVILAATTTPTHAPAPAPVQAAPAPALTPVAAVVAAAPAPTPIPAAAAPLPTPAPVAAAAPAPAPVVAAAAPRPRVPFDLAIEMLSCFKDVNRAQALALLDAASSSSAPAAKSAGSDYVGYGDAAASASSPTSSAGEEGSYVFRYCNDPDERGADGSINKDLFVLSYLHERKMYNTKIWRHYVGSMGSPTNTLGVATVMGYVLSEEKTPLTKERQHTSVLTITHSIIGPHAKAIVVQ